MATIDDAVRIESGSSADLDPVMEVMDAAFGNRFGEAWTRSQLSGILPMAGVSLMLARARRDVIGFSLFRSVADECELLLIAVRPDRHRSGVGRMLLEHFFDCARSKGAAQVHLEVRDGNPAIAMYQSAGFVPVGRRRNYYHGIDGKGFDAITLAQRL